jgi:hypothetical protein
VLADGSQSIDKKKHSHYYLRTAVQVLRSTLKVAVRFLKNFLILICVSWHDVALGLIIGPEKRVSGPCPLGKTRRRLPLSSSSRPYLHVY